MLMRLIGEECDLVQNELKENYKRDDWKAKSPNFWDCSLWSLAKAIVEVFSDKIELDESEKTRKIKDLRNLLFHSNFVELMNKLGIEPIGLQIFPAKELKRKNIKETILSLEKNGVLRQVEIRANEAIAILKKILLSLAI